MTIATAFAAVLIAGHFALRATLSVEDNADRAIWPAALGENGPTDGMLGTEVQSNGEMHE